MVLDYIGKWREREVVYYTHELCVYSSVRAQPARFEASETELGVVFLAFLILYISNKSKLS